MKTNTISIQKLATLALVALVVGLSGCAKKKGGKKVAVAPPAPCVAGSVCQGGGVPIAGSQLLTAVSYWGVDPNYFAILNIQNTTGQPTNYQQNGQYVGNYNGQVVVNGVIHAVNPQNYVCSLLNGDYDIVTTQPGQMSGWQIFSGLNVNLTHRQSGQVLQGYIARGFFTGINPWAPPGTSVAYNFGAYFEMYFNGPQQGCVNSYMVFGTP